MHLWPTGGCLTKPERGSVSITTVEIALEDERRVRTKVMLKTKSKHEFSSRLYLRGRWRNGRHNRTSSVRPILSRGG